MIPRRCKSLFSLAALALLAVLTTGCQVPVPTNLPAGANGSLGRNATPKTPVTPGQGALVSMYTAPLMTDFEGDAVGTKRGESKTYYVKEPFTFQFSASWMDGSIEEAIRDGGITKVSHIDYEVFQILGVFGSFKVIAYGE